MTMGIVLVVFLAAWIAGVVPVTITSTLSWTSSDASTGNRSLFPPSVAILNDDVLSLKIAKFLQTLPERLDTR
jgi:hypothetical protein